MKKLLRIGLNKTQKHIIFTVTLGNILEWYDSYLYVFWAPILSKQFFNQEGIVTSLLFAIGCYTIGFIFRPLGGLFFGRLGDRIGRKKAFISSLVMMSAPTFLIGFIPTYDQIGLCAPIILAILHITQTFPSGGELPGVFCYLYESGAKNKKFVTSFSGFGNQIGCILAATESYFLAKHLPVDSFPDLGWRISFIVGGVIGLCGIVLRYRLHETAAFQSLASHHKIIQTPFRKLFQRNWEQLIRGSCFGAMQTVCYHFIAIVCPMGLFPLIKLTPSKGLVMTILFLVISTVSLPIYGWLGERYSIVRLSLISCLCTLGVSYPLYLAIKFSYTGATLYLIGAIALFVSCLTAIWPYFIAHLFETPIRYTCIGLSFNLSDGVFGGLSSFALMYFINSKQDFYPLFWMICISSVISILACKNLKSNRKKESVVNV